LAEDDCGSGFKAGKSGDHWSEHCSAHESKRRRRKARWAFMKVGLTLGRGRRSAATPPIARGGKWEVVDAPPMTKGPRGSGRKLEAESTRGDEEMPSRNAAMDALCLKFALWAHQYFSTSQYMRVILLRFGKEGGVSLAGCVGDEGELPLRDTTNSATATIWTLSNETGTPSSFPAPPAENSRRIPARR